MPKGIPLTPAEVDRRRHEIFAASVHLFLEKGFAETSMREIAAAAGVGKSTLYDYFKTKDEILISYVEDEIYDLTVAAQEIAARPLPALQRLRLVLEKQVEYLLANKEFYLKLSLEVQRLAAGSQQSVQAIRHAYQDLVRRLIEDGIQEGALRPVDALITARTLIAILTPTVFTSRPSGTPQEMLAIVFDILLNGIRK